MEEHRRGISPASAEHVDLQEQLGIRIDRSVEPLCLAGDSDLFFVDGDPRRLRRRRVSPILRERVCPVPNRSVGTVNVESLEHRDDFSERQPHRMETHPEYPDGCRGALVLSNLITVHTQRLSEQVPEFHDQYSLRPARFSSTLN